jgi:hypothetical protein
MFGLFRPMRLGVWASARPVLIFAACLSVGVIASSRWLPDLAVGPVGGFAFFVVCGLLGIALGLVGLHVYAIVEGLEPVSGNFRKVVLADDLASMAWEVGSVFGLAVVVYLLAPPAETAEEPMVGSATIEL